jgi:hypothetical protein
MKQRTMTMLIILRDLMYQNYIFQRYKGYDFYQTIIILPDIFPL